MQTEEAVRNGIDDFVIAIHKYWRNLIYWLYVDT